MRISVKINYIVIPLIVIVVAFMGLFFTRSGMDWYHTLQLPAIAPSSFFIALVWNIIFLLTTVAALDVWNNKEHKFRRVITMFFFMVNAALNVAWCYLFFYRHMIDIAVWDAALLDFSVIILILLIGPMSQLCAALLLPYALWTTFAVYLNYLIWSMNG